MYTVPIGQNPTGAVSTSPALRKSGRTHNADIFAFQRLWDLNENVPSMIFVSDMVCYNVFTHRSHLTFGYFRHNHR